MLPLTIGFLIAGPISGILSDRFGSRPFATAGMLVCAASFLLLDSLPVNFSYFEFAGALLLMGLAMGAFASPNRAGVMNSLPAGDRGAGGAMNQTFQNSAQVLSIGIFFTLMIVGLAATLPSTLSEGLQAHGVPAATAATSRTCRRCPCSSPRSSATTRSGRSSARMCSGTSRRPTGSAHTTRFFPNLIAGPFSSGLHKAFLFAIAACLLAAAMSWSRGGRVRTQRAGTPAVRPDDVSEPDLI